MLLATLGGFMLALGLAFVVEVMASAAAVSQMRRPDARALTVQPSPVVVPSAVVTAPSVSMPPVAPPVASFGTGPAAGAVFVPPVVTAAPVPSVVAPVPVAQPADGRLATLPGLSTSMLAIHASSQALFDAGSTYRNAIEPVIAGVRHLVTNNGYRRIAVVNLTGRTYDSLAFSLALSRLLAMGGLKTILIDAGNGAPGIDALEQGFAGKGIYDLVSSTAGFADVIRKDNRTQLQVVVSGNAAGQSETLAQSPLMDQAINALEQVYQVCLVHVGEGTDANVQIAANSSVVLVLAEAPRLAEAAEICAALKAGRVRESAVVAVDPGTARSSASAFKNIAASL